MIKREISDEKVALKKVLVYSSRDAEEGKEKKKGKRKERKRGEKKREEKLGSFSSRQPLKRNDFR